jgi:hypothetical protein
MNADLDRLAELLEARSFDVRGPDLADIHHRATRRRGARTALVGALLAAGVATMFALGPLLQAHSSTGGASRVGSSAPTANAALYPPAASFPSWGLASGCPDARNLDSITVAERADLLAAAGRIGSGRDASFEVSDQAYWPILKQSTSAETSLGSLAADSTEVQSAAASDLSDLLTNNCGTPAVSHSLVLVVCPNACSLGQAALNDESVWLRRDGVWLRWFER